MAACFCCCDWSDDDEDDETAKDELFVSWTAVDVVPDDKEISDGSTKPADDKLFSILPFLFS